MSERTQQATATTTKVVRFGQTANDRAATETSLAQLHTFGSREFGVVSEESFRELLSLERKRTERSGKPFLLMLLNVRGFSELNGRAEAAYRKTLEAFTAATRETDIKGWYQVSVYLGVVFTELSGVDREARVAAIRAKMESALAARMEPALLSSVALSFHWFPEEIDTQGPRLRKDLALYPDLTKSSEQKKISLVIKRVMDVVGSALALAIFSPLFLLIALGIRLSSKGPILFRQHRIGQHGAPFIFLKFRTMYEGNDPSIHKEFVTRLITKKARAGSADVSNSGLYKIANDPRVTRMGQFLRKTSLDELPQFWNVLIGEMSLVGPRPPIPYELENYDVWHRRRVLEVKPGITGLWQVIGRSRTTFDEMVRLDLKYARSWSPWLDVKILLRTPKAVLSGNGAC